MLTTIKNDSDWPEYPVGRVTTIGDEGGETLGSHHQEQYPAIAPDFNDFDNSLESTPENPETPKENGNPEEEELLDSPKTHLDPSNDFIYILYLLELSIPTPRRIRVVRILSRKAKENNVQSNPFIQARLAEYYKSDKTLTLEEIYYRMTTIAQEDLIYYDFDPDFNFYTIITFVRLMKSYLAIKTEEDIYEL